MKKIVLGILSVMVVVSVYVEASQLVSEQRPPIQNSPTPDASLVELLPPGHSPFWSQNGAEKG